MAKEFNTAQEAQKWIDGKMAEYKSDRTDQFVAAYKAKNGGVIDQVTLKEQAEAPVDMKEFEKWLSGKDKKLKEAGVTNMSLAEDFKAANKVVEDSKKKSTAKGADGKPAADGRHDANVDTSSAPEGEKKEQGEGEGVGGFLNNNKYGLGAALMVGLLATAMGGGGIMGLIMGLLAMMIVGSMMDKGGVANNIMGKGKEGDSPDAGKGKTRAKEAVPGAENAIDVKEGTEVAVKNKEGQFLSSQKDGKPVYTAAAGDVTLLTRDEQGNPTGLIKGRVNGANFDVSQVASILPDARMGDLKPTSGSISIDGDGEIDLRSQAMNNARKPGAQAAADYAKEQSIELKVNDKDKTVSAVIGKADKYSVVATGVMDKDNNVVFNKAVVMDGDKPVSGTNGSPIEVAMPEGKLQKIASKDGKISPMTGDAQKAAVAIGTAVLGEQKKQAEAKSTAETKEMGGVNKELGDAKTLKDVEDVIASKWTEKLVEAGSKPYAAAAQAVAVKEMYKNGDFVGKTADEAAAKIAGALPEGIDTEKVKDFAKRTNEVFNGAIKDKSEDGKEKGAVLGDPKSPTEQMPEGTRLAVTDYKFEGENFTPDAGGGKRPGGRDGGIA